MTAAGERVFVSKWDGRPVHSCQLNFLIRPLTFDVVLPEPTRSTAGCPQESRRMRVWTSTTSARPGRPSSAVTR
ncbi:hypothetical protein [Streptomyces lutosisoli]|uniref:Uncharacterized protein n=1 Tax=Streptomyces lutosisoli TaxID=2665721 RepID=A0ABW2VVX0_9ACTN